ncbi:unnamed protein product [Camellia sinensis]
MLSSLVVAGREWHDDGLFKRELKEEKYAVCKAILPILQAEEYESGSKYLEEDARIMKDVPRWKVGECVYNFGRWMPPAIGELNPDVW